MSAASDAFLVAMTEADELTADACRRMMRECAEMLAAIADPGKPRPWFSGSFGRYGAEIDATRARREAFRDGWGMVSHFCGDDHEAGR